MCKYMNVFAKTVAVILLIACGLLPTAPLTLCQKELQSSTHCAPGCPMMAGVETARAERPLTPADFSQSCCNMSPTTPISIFFPSAKQQLRGVVLVDDSLAALTSIERLRKTEDRSPQYWHKHNYAQALLCLFLI